MNRFAVGVGLCFSFLGFCFSAFGQGGIQLPAALDATNLTWSTSGTGGAGGWMGTSFLPRVGSFDAMSQLVSGEQTSVLQTTLTGPGSLSFWWRNPSFNNTLSFKAGDAFTTAINGSTNWQLLSVSVGPGVQELKWIYKAAIPPTDLANRGYVDGVSFISEALPVITVQPISQSQVPGLAVTFTVSAAGPSGLSYQWQLRGTNIAGATTSSYSIANVQSNHVGRYNVVVSDGVTSITSSNAMLELGEVTAWGWSNFGGTAVAIGATNILAVAAGDSFGLALRGDGTQLSWGANIYGQGTLKNPTDVLAISAGAAHSLALNRDGRVTAWGANNNLQTNVPPGLDNVAAIAAGLSNSFALTAMGTVVGWGSGSPTALPPGSPNAVAIAASSANYLLALKPDGTVVTGYQGPGLPSNLSNVVAIAAGAGHNLALRANGTVAAWGQNLYGQTTVPAGLSNIVAIAAGYFHSLALRADGTVVAWGRNLESQTNVPSGLTNVTAIAAGAYHSVALVKGAPVTVAESIRPTRTGNVFSLSIPAQSGRVYQLEYKNALSDAMWTALPLFAGDGNLMVLTDPAATNSQRVYRVRRW